jgi:signal transduction histidine kinase
MEQILYVGANDAEAARCVRALRSGALGLKRFAPGAGALAACGAPDTAVVLLGTSRTDRAGLNLLRSVADQGASVIAIADNVQSLRVASRLGARDGVLSNSRTFADDLLACVKRALDARRLQTADSSGDAIAVPRTQFVSGADLSGPMLSAIGHEITNPITALLGYSQLLADADALGEETGLIAGRLEVLAQTVLDLVTGLLDTLRAAGGTLALNSVATDLNQMVDAAVQRVARHARREKRRFVLRLASLLPTVPVDRARFARALDLVLMAALMETPAGGSVKIATSAGSRGVQLQIAARGTPTTAPLGSRICEAALARITLARALIEAHAGTVECGPTGCALTIVMPAGAGRLAASQ